MYLTVNVMFFPVPLDREPKDMMRTEIDQNLAAASQNGYYFGGYDKVSYRRMSAEFGDDYQSAFGADSSFDRWGNIKEFLRRFWVLEFWNTGWCVLFAANVGACVVPWMLVYQQTAIGEQLMSEEAEQKE